MRVKRRWFQSAAGGASRRHLWLLAYWPFYTLAYFGIERLGGRTEAVCTSCALDRAIPFIPAFIAPYLMWFPFWIGMLAYALFREPRLFRRLMHYFMLTFSTAVLLFWLFPTSAGLRPETVPGGGLFAALTRLAYRIDMDVNACPSEHIIGVFAVIFAVWDSERLSKPRWKRLAAGMGGVIAASTVFVRQHALVDLVAAAALSGIGWLACFRPGRKRAGDTE